MKKRGTYIIFTGCGSSRYMAGPSLLSQGGSSVKQILSNELYFHHDYAFYQTLQDFMPIRNFNGSIHEGNNIFNCDFGNDTPEEILGELYYQIGLPVKDSKSIIMDALSRYDCENPIDLGFKFDIYNGYKTLNFKRFLMSRGFDVEIYDSADLYEFTGIEDDYDGERLIKNFIGNYETYTGKSSRDIEYVLIANGGRQGYTVGLHDDGDVFDNLPENICGQGRNGIIASARNEGIDPDDNQGGGGTKGDINYGLFWPDGETDGPSLNEHNIGNGMSGVFPKLPQAIVGRWSLHQFTTRHAHDVAFKVINTIEYHTNEAQKALYYNPNYNTTGDGSNISTGGTTTHNGEMLVSWCSNLKHSSKTTCEQFGHKWNEAEPGYQYEKIMGCYNNDILNTVDEFREEGDSDSGLSNISPDFTTQVALGDYKRGIDYEPPVSRNKEFIKRYKTAKDDDYLNLMMEAAQWNEDNPSPYEEDEFGCPEGYFWDIVTEECIQSNMSRAFVTPVNHINWLRRRWDDLGHTMWMEGHAGQTAINNIREQWPKGYSVFNYRGAGWSGGPFPHPNLNWEDYWQENYLDGLWNPMVGLSFVCDNGDFESTAAVNNGVCFCDAYMNPLNFKSFTAGQSMSQDHFYPGMFAAWIGASELHTEAKFNGYLLSNFWRYMFDEVSEDYLNAKNNQRGWEILKNQEIGYALDMGKFGLDSEPELNYYEGSYQCGIGGSLDCPNTYRLCYNILGDPSLSFYIGKPKNIYIESGYSGQFLNLREGITLPNLDFTISLGSGHAGVRLDEAVGVVLFNTSDEPDAAENWITLTKSYSDNNGNMEFNIPSDELPPGRVLEFFIQINRYQHWPVNFRVYYNS